MSLYFDEIKNCNFAKRFSLKNPKFVGTSCNMFLDVLDFILRMKEVFSFYFSGGMFAPKTILLEFDEMKPKQRKKNVKRCDEPSWQIKKLACHYSVKWQWTN